MEHRPTSGLAAIALSVNLCCLLLLCRCLPAVTAADGLLEAGAARGAVISGVAPERDTDDYPDYLLGVRYDEYPTIVPKKRAAVLLDRLMVAIQKAIEEGDTDTLAKLRASSSRTGTRSDDAVRSMDLQRRGHQASLTSQQKGRVYWRCYFNAVTCFK